MSDMIRTERKQNPPSADIERDPRPRDLYLVAATRWSLLVLLASYCFVWPRLPVGPIDLPLQRALVLITCGLLALTLTAHRRAFPKKLMGRAGRIALGLSIVLLLTVGVGFLTHVNVDGFNTLAWVMDAVKYVACVAAMFAVYLGLRVGIISLRATVNAVIASSLACIVIAYVCLVAYVAGFRSFDDHFLRTFGGELGVWPTDGVLPRLVATGTEPQQLSILFVTGLLLMMLSRRRALWVGAGAGVGVLLLSQSKFALGSALIVVVVATVIVGRRLRLARRGWLLLSTGFIGASLLVGIGLAQLPIFAQTLQEGSKAVAVTERVENAGILASLVQKHFLTGIGNGQYGIYRSQALNILTDPWYYPNMDYMKVFAELGVVGFIAIISLFILILGVYAVRATRVRSDSRPLIFAIGAIIIFINMAVGYEMLHIFLWLNLGVILFAAERISDFPTMGNNRLDYQE